MVAGGADFAWESAEHLVEVDQSRYHQVLTGEQRLALIDEDGVTAELLIDGFGPVTSDPLLKNEVTLAFCRWFKDYTSPAPYRYTGAVAASLAAGIKVVVRQIDGCTRAYCSSGQTLRARRYLYRCPGSACPQHRRGAGTPRSAGLLRRLCHRPSHQRNPRLHELAGGAEDTAVDSDADNALAAVNQAFQFETVAVPLRMALTARTRRGRRRRTPRPSLLRRGGASSQLREG
ncbi:MAG TPA: hypothetical protein VLJ57_12545 [Burkholderiaceae bacterium]|nr:hypothetical protein [Burkholderiaceae bacterium]